MTAPLRVEGMLVETPPHDAPAPARFPAPLPSGHRQGTGQHRGEPAPGTHTRPRRRTRPPAPPDPRMWVRRLRHDPAMGSRVVAVVLVVAVTAGVILTARAALGERGGLARTPPARPLDPTLTLVARAVRPLVDVYPAPGSPLVVETLRHPTPTGSPLVLLVEARLGDWVRVRLPTPPAGHTGWVPAAALRLSEHHFRITVDLEAHRLTLYDGGDTVLDVPVSVGYDVPPPGTVTYVSEVLALPDSAGTYGTHALALAGFANPPDAFFRGNGAVALHGSPAGAVVGADGARGSIGLRNRDVQRLVGLVPAGTPVEVSAEARPASSL